MLLSTKLRAEIRLFVQKPLKRGESMKNFFWVSGPSLGCFWIVLRFWPKIFMKNACFLPKIEIGWDLGCFGKFHKILKIWHFLIMKKFFESGFLMSHGGLFPLGVKIHKSKKVYHKCVVAQRLWLLKVYFSYFTWYGEGPKIKEKLLMF